MIISDGTTELTLNSQEYNDDSDHIVSQKVTAGGQLRSRTSGDRFVTSETVRLNGSELAQLLELINNNSPEYFYTPDFVPPEWVSADFPMGCAIVYERKTTRAIGATSTTGTQSAELVYYITLRIESNILFRS